MTVTDEPRIATAGAEVADVHPQFAAMARAIDRDRRMSDADKLRATWVAWTRYCSRSRATGANFLDLMLG